MIKNVTLQFVTDEIYQNIVIVPSKFNMFLKIVKIIVFKVLSLTKEYRFFIQMIHALYINRINIWETAWKAVFLKREIKYICRHLYYFRIIILRRIINNNL